MDNDNKKKEEKDNTKKNLIKTLLLKKINVYKKENKNILDSIIKSLNDSNSFFSYIVDGKKIIIGKKIPQLKDEPISINEKEFKPNLKGLRKSMSPNFKNKKKISQKSLNKYNQNLSLVDNYNMIINNSNNYISKEKEESSSNIYKKTIKNIVKASSIPLIEKYPISDTELNDIYDSYKQIEIKNKDSLINKKKTPFNLYNNYNINRNNSKSNNVSLLNSLRNNSLNLLNSSTEKSLNSLLKLQENTLNLNKKHIIENKKIETKIAKSTKKDKKDLLMNQTNFYRAFKEIKYKNENELSSNHYSNTLKWLMNLRLNDNFSKNNLNRNFIKETFINTGSLTRPKFAVIYKNLNKQNEKIRNHFNKFDYLKLSKSQKSFKSKINEAFSDLDDLRIKGKKLLDYERENSSLIKGKKIIYKKIHRKDEKEDLDFIYSYSYKDFARNQIIDNCSKLHNDFEKVEKM